MTLRRWEPDRDMERMRREMERFWGAEPFAWRGRFPRLLDLLSSEAGVALDMYEEGNNVIVKADVPGFKSEEVKVDVTGDVLTIRGESKQEMEEKKQGYYMKERRYGTFSRSVALPPGVDKDRVDATFDDGVLTVTIPKTEAAKTKTVTVKPKARKG